METANRLEHGESWGARGAEWARLEGLLELARRAHREAALSPERRDQIRARVLERLERNEIRRRRRRLLIVGASAVLLGAWVWMRVRSRLASKA